MMLPTVAEHSVTLRRYQCCRAAAMAQDIMRGIVPPMVLCDICAADRYSLEYMGSSQHFSDLLVAFDIAFLEVSTIKQAPTPAIGR